MTTLRPDGSGSGGGTGAPVLARACLIAGLALAAGTSATSTRAAAGAALPAPNQPPASEQLVAHHAGGARQPRFSPDGQHLVYSASEGGPPDLWIVGARGGTPRQLTATPYGETAPAWSPDGRTIAFAASRNGSEGIWSIPASGGEARRVFSPPGARAFSPDFAPDGRLAVTVLRPDSTRTHGEVSIWVMEHDGRNARRVTHSGDTWHARWDAQGEWLHYYVGATDELRAVHGSTGEERNVDAGRFVGWMPTVSPDGGHLAFVSSPHWSLWIAPIAATGGPVRITTSGETRSPSFSPDGEWIAFSRSAAQLRLESLEVETGARTLLGHGTSLASAPDTEFAFVSAGPDGRRRMMVTSRRGAGPPREIPLGFGDVSEFTWSIAGQIAATTSGGAQPDAGLWLTTLQAAAPRRLLDERVSTPRWCGDGQLAYSRDAAGTWQLFRHDAATGDRVQLTRTSGGKLLTSCAPDGRWMSYRTFGAAPRAGVIDFGAGRPVISEDRRWLEVTRSPDGVRTAFVQRSVEGWPDIYLRDAAGSVRRLTHDARMEEGITFSSDGRHLAFGIRDAVESIWVAPVPALAVARPARAQPVVTPDVFWDYQPTWSPDGRAIAFCSSRDAHPRTSLYVMDTAGRDVRRLTNPAAGTGDCFPKWSPDGARIAFTSDRSGNREVYVVGLEGGPPQQLTRHQANDGWHVAWTPDGRRLVFSSDRDSTTTLYSMARDGSDVRRVAPRGSGARTPSVSPDGLLVAFEARGDLWLVSAQGGEPRRLTTLPSNEGGASWHPTGTHLVFYSDLDDPQYELYSIRVDGSGLRRLTRSPNWDLDPSFSSDGRRLAWHSSDIGRYGIVVADSGGQRRRRLTNNVRSPFVATVRDRGVDAALAALDSSRRAGIARSPALGDEVVALVHELAAENRHSEALRLATAGVGLIRDSITSFEALGAARRAAALEAPPSREVLMAALRRGDAATVRAAHALARSIEPRWALLRREQVNAAGNVLLADGRHQEAVDILALLTELSPDWPIGWHSLGMAERASGRAEDAVAHLAQGCVLARAQSHAAERFLCDEPQQPT